MRLLFAASELAPLCQSGGLGDAVSGLARALGARGHEVTCVLPAYRQALASSNLPSLVDGGPIIVRFPGFELSGRFLCGELFPGVDVALLDIPALFDRAGLYGDAAGPYPDEALRFITLARAAAYRAEAEKPDVVVAHDWHAALALPTLRTALDRGRNREIGVVQTVHNNAYQGRVHVENYGLTGLANDLFHAEGLEAYGSLCMLKGGTMWADRVVAVSPTYAREIQTPAFGEGLEGAYQSRAHRLTGIVNGIDTVRFDPSTDRTLPAHFRAEDPSGKDTCRRALLEGLGLDAPAPGLLCAGIGRFAPQKGWDVLAASIDGLVELGATLVLLGDGDPWIARLLEEKRKQYPKKVSVRFGYDDAFARRIYAGADAVLVPSRFEPCGLVQLIAQRYGAVPIAHAVGGLVDTIVDPVFRGASRDDPWKRSTGILFAPLSPDTLISAVARCAALGESGRLPDVQRRLLELDVSWDGPAALWETLFAGVADEARRRR